MYPSSVIDGRAVINSRVNPGKSFSEGITIVDSFGNLKKDIPNKQGSFYVEKGDFLIRIYRCMNEFILRLYLIKEISNNAKSIEVEKIDEIDLPRYGFLNEQIQKLKEKLI